MKEGWKMTKLKEVCIITSGQSAPQGDEKYSLVGTPFVKAGNLLDLTNGVNENDIQQVKDDVATAHKLTLFPKGSVVFAKSGMSCLKGYIYTLKQNCYVVSHLAVLIPNDKIISPYLNYVLKLYKPSSLAADAAFPSVKLSELGLFSIPVPSLSEQQRIVDILDAEFAKIDALKENAEKNIQNAKDLFQAVLRKALEPKEGWETKKISEISENLDYKRVPVTKKDRMIGIYPYYGASGIVDYVDSYLFDEDLLLVSEDGANLLARSTPIAFSVYGKIWVNNHAHVLRFPNIELQKFVEYFFAGYDISEFVTGAAQPKFNQKSLNGILISYPTKIHEQKSVVSRLNLAYENCERLQENLKQTIVLCDNLKQALLRKAFNGEL